jgi:transposase-like protein
VNHPTLFVIDGSKALRKAIDSHFGEYAFIQRCQVHKKRNVKAYLSDSTWEDISSLLSAAYNETDYERASNKLRKAAKWLERINPLTADCASSRLNILHPGAPDTLLQH